MVLEYTGYDEQYRKYTAIHFFTGLIFIGTYYLYILPREKRREKISDQSGGEIEVVNINQWK